MNQIYLSSRWEEETFQDLSHAEPEEDHEVAPITPKLISSNQSYPHIYDVKLQTRQLSDDELSNLLNLKSKIYSEEWSKICEDDFDPGSDDEGQPQIKSKYWWVSTKQKQQILDFYFNKRLSRSEISQKMFVSYSTICRLIKDANKTSNVYTDWDRKEKRRPKIDKIAKALIVNYTTENTFPYSSRDIEIYLENKLNERYTKDSIIKFMKKQLNLSFKKWSSRPILKDPVRFKLYKSLFCIEFANIVNPSSILVKIDETSFSRHTKINYSRSKTGVSSSINNISFSGWLTLIWTITSRGDWFLTYLKESNKSSIFKDFIGNLIKWLWIDLKYKMDQIILLMDNCPIHQARNVIIHIEEFKWKIMFLSAYSPEFAPIELFFNTFKCRLAHQCKNQTVNL